MFKKLSIEYKSGKDDENQKIFYGAAPAFSFTSENRKNTTVLDRFNSPFFPKLLCGTSTLQEGVNLQGFCDRVYHFGILLGLPTFLRYLPQYSLALHPVLLSLT